MGARDAREIPFYFLFAMGEVENIKYLLHGSAAVALVHRHFPLCGSVSQKCDCGMRSKEANPPTTLTHPEHCIALAQGCACLQVAMDGGLQPSQ